MRHPLSDTTQQFSYAEVEIRAISIIHLCHDRGLGFCQRAGIGLKQQIGAVDPFDPAKAGDQMTALDDASDKSENRQSRHRARSTGDAR